MEETHMSTITVHAPGTLCWAELGTTDVAAAQRFYRGLFGWEVREEPTGQGPYYIFRLGGRDVAALMELMPEQRKQGIPPCWGSYFAVESADRAAETATRLGGKAMMEPFDVMEHGRMAVFQDPQGAVFSLWQAKKHPGAGVVDEPGSLTWVELLTTDTAKAKDFYTTLFGWTTDTMPIPSGTYTMYKVPSRGVGGMMAITPDMGPVPPNWMVYFAVEDCDRAATRAKELGAKTIVPTTPIPNMGRFAVFQDPQGAFFAIYQSAPKA
jgi:predicted enzyme related to lactoylglutathione lyase